jgi:transcriptional regulator with XRE-family HTH domain
MLPMSKLPSLRYYRRLEALSQRALAELAGVTYATIARIELAQHEPTGSTIRKLAAALGVRPRDLMAAPPEDDVTA